MNGCGLIFVGVREHVVLPVFDLKGSSGISPVICGVYYVDTRASKNCCCITPSSITMVVVDVTNPEGSFRYTLQGRSMVMGSMR